ncbi:MAG: MBL fold metallo-hydrolase [Desulfobulbus sp.]|jgi:glyoxylase-like metal-dependent hydrolase (beta-lactamase superfamily II)/rhodanese-related sulfurtransferase|uniref:MBL fold metallo-hydrolase n=1 Tax=Desulfobulbus sp. TaxID=895 RepID=UPI002845ADD5|nr:MBL fold metallo-hydrolase [Desulfobulbus sp.]MDR2550927.1 MBL fold metallo-hydrolase [Desulfobulbus sp.]
MAIYIYEAKDLFHWLSTGVDMVVLDVRNAKDFARFQVESPRPFTLVNISYFDFIEDEEEAVARVPRNRAVRIVCAKENSARYVAEILDRHGFEVGYLQDGISSWGNLLVPRPVGRGTDYELFQFIRPGKASCSYGLVSGKEMMLFDPSRNLDFYLEFAAQQGCMVTKTFETHLQADYIAGSRDIARQTGAIFYANDGDFKTSNNPYTPLRDGETLRFGLGGPDVRAMFTPGHTPGSTSYLIDERFLLSGDTVFIDSVGRPDLGGKAEEWAVMLYETIRAVKRLDPNLQVLPGHYIDWREANEDLVFSRSLGGILERNRAIYEIDNPATFVAFIQANMRPQPEEYATIRLVNANLREEEQVRQEELDLGKNECAASAYAKAQQPRSA